MIRRHWLVLRSNHLYPFECYEYMLSEGAGRNEEFSAREHIHFLSGSAFAPDKYGIDC